VLTLKEIRVIEHGRHVADVLERAETLHAAGRPWTHLRLLRELYSDFDAKHAPVREHYGAVWAVACVGVAGVLLAPWWASCAVLVGVLVVSVVGLARG